jgi:hypothetical protein
MKRTLGLLIVLALAATPAFAQKITIYYDKEFDFDSIKTFAYADTKQSNARDPEVDERIKYRMIGELKESGLTLVETDPDLWVTYHIAGPGGTPIDPGAAGYDANIQTLQPWGGLTATSNEVKPVEYIEGQLMLDAYDPKSKTMVWRATSDVALKNVTTAKLRAVDDSFKKIGVKWNKILAEKGK